MSNLNTNTLRIYGGNPSNDILIQQASSPSNAGVTETVAVGTSRRSFLGPKSGGHYSFHLFVDGAGGATSTMTVWYSNHPNPSLITDNDWVQDTTVGSFDLTLTGGKFTNVGNINAEWVMLKVIVVTSTANIRCFVRVEGVQHGKV